MESSFSLKRIGWLGKKEFFESFLPHFKIMSIVLAGMLFLKCLIAYFSNDNVHVSGIEGMFVIFAFIYTVSSFSEFKHLATRADYLNLPATAGEKVFTKWIFGNVFYWIAAFALFLLFYLLQHVIIGVLMNKNFDVYEYNFLDPELYKGLYFIIVIFSVYFFGAACFNTGAWYKVILWGLIAAMAYMLIVFLFAYALFPDMRAALHGVEVESQYAPVDLILEDFWLIRLGEFFIKYLAAPFFWFMTYLKLKEKEV